jgi:hypothetical protein
MHVFYVKIKLFVTLTSERIRIRIGLAPWIQIHIELKQTGSGSVLKPMRIHNTGKNLQWQSTDHICHFIPWQFEMTLACI